MPASHHSEFFTGRMIFLLPIHQHQSTEGICKKGNVLLLVLAESRSSEIYLIVNSNEMPFVDLI